MAEQSPPELEISSPSEAGLAEQRALEHMMEAIRLLDGAGQGLIAALVENAINALRRNSLSQH
jgi:hypothetical protein